MSLNTLIKRVEDDATIVIDWFRYNYMKLNPDKCHILISGCKHEVILAKVGNVNAIESHKVTLLGIEIDSDLKFHNHISMICSLRQLKNQMPYPGNLIYYLFEKENL